MQTRRFEPTPAWQHALEQASCPHHLLALAKVEGQVIGWCRLFPVVQGQPDPIELGIGVLQAHRRQGVGMAMLGYVMGWATCQFIARIVLTTHIGNKPAVRLFEKFSFYGKRQEGYQLKMVLDINHQARV